MSQISDYKIAQTYEDLITGLFCTSCHHLISDHFEFKSDKSAKCFFTQSKDGTFSGCDCKKIERNFKFTFKPEELVTANAA